MKLRPFLTMFVAGAIPLFGAADLVASPIQFDAFIATPDSAVHVFDDGFSVTIGEDAVVGGHDPVSLENMNFSFPDGALTLGFDYELYVADSNTNFFDFCIGDASKPAFQAGGVGEFTAAGHFTYDLTQFSGKTAPIVFHLISDWEDEGFDSSVTITNAYVSIVPIPGTLMLLSSGLLGLIGMYRAKKGESRRKHGLS